MKELIEIQSKLKAPKGQYNSFGKYRYRSCEDILEGVKPLLTESGCTLTISDDIILVGSRIYVKATVTLKNGNGESEVVTAFAREEETKKGMDGSQVTGAASSYARKYALNGMFCIDDTKDSDATNTYGKEEQKPQGDDDFFAMASQEVARCNDLQSLQTTWGNYPSLQSDKRFISAVNKRKGELQ